MEQITNVQSFGSHNNDCGNMTNSNNTTIILNRADEDNQIKKWLSPLEPRYKHQSVQTNRVSGVGDWLLERSEFLEWSGSPQVPEKTVLFSHSNWERICSQEASKQTVLFCYGDPGVGKTHIR